jgi:thiamine pyrophosphate-dependent acetolactate synthase large subunit-like protein
VGVCQIVEVHGDYRGVLRDAVLDWDDALPEDQLQMSEEHARGADLVLCLGTSLQIRPICNLPNITKRNGGCVVIVNLQRTPKHKLADLVLHARCDEVMQQVMHELQRPIPSYCRWDRFHLRLWRAYTKRPRDEVRVACSIRSSHIGSQSCCTSFLYTIQHLT